ncbi:MAG: PLP-dependent aspartate aminotransferase family protein [Acidobacteriota bacterium]
MSDQPQNHPGRMRPGSRVIHGGQQPEPVTGAIMPPIVTAATYVQESPGQHKGFEYTRSHNPTRYALERMVASLEGSAVREDQDPSLGGFAFASGLAATGTLLELVDQGSRVVAMDDLYGGTRRLMTQVRARTQGLDLHYADLSDAEVCAEVLTAETRMVWVETPTNPLMKLADLSQIARLAKAANPEVLLVCDNTFATPRHQRPLEHGFDIAMHSSTKYLNGHSDVVGGVVVAKDAALAERLRFLQNAIGSVMGPIDAYLTLRGIKTLDVRMERHSRNAQRVAEYLESHPKVERVVFPGLPSHPQHELAKAQMSDFGGMVTFWLRGGLEEARTLLESVCIFQLAESLGAVESLVNHPAIMTHASVPAETRAALGISDSLIRLSVGIEDPEDQLEDLEQALAKVSI